MSKATDLLLNLGKSIAECANVFQTSRIAHAQASATKTSPQDELLTRAYLVLVHAALEEFFEQLAEYVSDESSRHWPVSPKKSMAASALLLFHGKSEGKIEDLEPRFTDRGRKALEESIDYHKSSVINQNNGISIRHLRMLFFPLGVDLPEDIKLLTAIDELKRIRGDAAHRGRSGRSNQKPMKEWIHIVEDCEKFCEKLVVNVDKIQW